jgi:hypothetical protein
MTQPSETDFCGCVYAAPLTNKFDPQAVGDLTAEQLKAMKLVGLPIKASHGRIKDEVIGEVTDEYLDHVGGKHISFRIFDDARFDGFREGVKQNWYSHLSLGHEVRATGPVAQEVSICHLGARAGTVLARTTPLEYKQALAQRGMTDNMSSATETPTPVQTMDTKPDTEPEVVADAPPVDETPEERALRIMAELDQDKQEAIAGAWTMTSQKLAEVQGKLDEAEKANSAMKAENSTLREATRETAAQLVESIRQAYADQGTAFNERYADEIQTQVQANPVLGQALQQAIPIVASAGSRKRARLEEPAASSDMAKLTGFLRAAVRERGHAAFRNDFASVEPVSVQASAGAAGTAGAAARQEKAAEKLPFDGPGSHMLASLRASLRR